MVAKIHAFGVEKLHYVQSIASLSASLVDLAAGDFVPVLDMQIDPERTFEPSSERLGTASLADEIEGKQGGKWSTSFYPRIAGLGVASDFDALLTAAFGAETISGGTSVTYSFDETIEPPLLNLARAAGGAYEQAFGCVVEQIDFDVAGNTAPKVTLSGSFASYSFCYTSTLASPVAVSDPSLTVGSGEGVRFAVGALIQFGDNTAVVTGVSGDVVSFAPNATDVVASGEVVEGQRPAGTTTGTILNGVQCILSANGANLGFTSAKFSVKTGYSLLNDEATSKTASRLGRSKREITGDLGVYFDTTEAGDLWGKANNNTLVPTWSLSMGPITSGGEAAVITLPLCRVFVGSADIPEAEVATGSVKLMPRMDSAAGDEMVLTFE